MVTYTYRLPRTLLDSDVIMPSANGNKTSVTSNGDTNFDSNMVIILAALLCALICALGLNSIVRSTLRCTQTYRYETSGEFESRLSSPVIKKEAVINIPVAVYGSEFRFPATDCPICLGEFIVGEDVRILPRCNHGFHVKCIDRWLMVQYSCPTCRQKLSENYKTVESEESMSVQID